MITAAPERIADEKEIALDRVQRGLQEALHYFLYSTVCDSRLGRGLVRRWLLSSQPLAAVCSQLQAVGVARHRLGTGPLWEQMTVTRFAERLARLYRVWEEIGPRADQDDTTVSPGAAYAAWMRAGGDQRKYRPVHLLRQVVQQRGRDLFLRAMVHGSVATLDDVAGFSDMDTVFIVKASVLTDVRQLLSLRRAAIDMLTLTYAFDPVMHHGPHYLSELDLRWYPEASFPTVLFRHGVDLLDGAQDIHVGVRPSGHMTHAMLEAFDRFFSQQAAGRFAPRDSFDLEQVMGSAMLLPALYLQARTGVFRYKRDTFPLAQQYFPATLWEPVDSATRLRAGLSARPTPSDWQVAVARALQWPGLLQRWARQHPAHIRRAAVAAEQLGTDYPRRVQRLLAAMQDDLRLSLDGPVASPSAASARSAGAFFSDVSQGPYTELPLQRTREAYDRVTDHIVARWNALPRQQRPLAIYQLGQVGAPGISDLDFVVIFRDGQSVDWKHYVPAAFSSEVRELLMHPPYVCSARTWADFPASFPTFALRHVSGESLGIPALPPQHAAGCALGMLVDYLIVRIPLDFLWAAWKRPVCVRTLLNFLHSLQYTVQLADSAGLPVPAGAPEVVARINRLRLSWGEATHDSYRVLQDLCAEATAIAGELITQVDVALQQVIGRTEQVSNGVCRRPAGLFNFTRGWTFEGAMRAVSESYWRADWPAWVSPASFVQVLAVYGHECPQFDGYLRARGCRTEQQWNGGAWEAGLRHHARAMTAYAEYAASLGVPPQKYIALGYQPPRRAWEQSVMRGQSAWRVTKRLFRRDLSVHDAAMKALGALQHG